MLYISRLKYKNNFFITLFCNIIIGLILDKKVLPQIDEQYIYNI